MIDPRSRQRVQTVPVKPTIRSDVTNGELLSQFERSVQGRLSRGTAEKYRNAIADAIRYFRSPEGREVPVREWTKEGVWEYVHYMENNYCTHYRNFAWTAEASATCRKRVWIGLARAEEATRTHCSGCPLFKRPNVRARLHGLDRFYRYLARVGSVRVNFMNDVVREYYDDLPAEGASGEKRRNPTLEEMRRLVNETHHPARRAFYAASAKWWFRPNEMLMLDRYASFGFATPEGVPQPRGFEDGFSAHPDLASFAQGGDMVYLPRTKGDTDKRKGNRWSVIDAELRPILAQYFEWWDKTVKRDASGKPRTTVMWLNERGRPIRQPALYPRLFTNDCLRLGLMKPGDERDIRRAWTGHCQRHFGEQVRQLYNVPADWSNHLRGDAFKDARGDYYQPPPEHVRRKYHELIPKLGFMPLPSAPLKRG